MLALTSLVVVVVVQTLLLLPWWSGEVGAITLHACEGNHVKLMCPMRTRHVIIIRSAMYGRRSDPTGTPGRCGDNLVIHRFCEEDVTKLMKFRCEGKPICEVYVDVATFGIDICQDVRKYVEVTYDCVPVNNMNNIKHCYETCAPRAAAAPVNTFASKIQWSKTQIPGPAAGNSVAPAGHAPSASASSPPAAVPSPPRASSSTSSSSQSPSAKPTSPSHNPAAQALPYGNLNRSIAAALSQGSGTSRTASTSGAARTLSDVRSAAVRRQLMNRMRILLLSLRNRKQG